MASTFFMVFKNMLRLIWALFFTHIVVCNVHAGTETLVGFHKSVITHSFDAILHSVKKENYLKLNIPLDKTFSIEDVNPDALPSLFRYYGEELFDLDFSKGLNIDIRLRDLTVQAIPEITKSKIFIDKRKLKASLEISLSNIAIYLHKFEISETKITQKKDPLIQCHPNAQKEIKGEVLGAYLGDFKKRKKIEGDPAKAQINIEWDIDRDRLKTPKINIDFDDAFNDQKLYAHLKDLIIPKLSMWVESDKGPRCMPLDDMPVKIFVEKMIPLIKQAIIKGITKLTTEKLPAYLEEQFRGISLKEKLVVSFKLSPTSTTNPSLDVFLKSISPIAGSTAFNNVENVDQSFWLSLDSQINLRGNAINGAPTKNDFSLKKDELFVIAPLQAFRETMSVSLREIMQTKKIAGIILDEIKSPVKEGELYFLPFLRLDVPVIFESLVSKMESHKNLKKVFLIVLEKMKKINSLRNISTPLQFKLQKTIDSQNEKILFQIIPPKVENLFANDFGYPYLFEDLRKKLESLHSRIQELTPDILENLINILMADIKMKIEALIVELNAKITSKLNFTLNTQNIHKKGLKIRQIDFTSNDQIQIGAVVDGYNRLVSPITDILKKELP